MSALLKENPFIRNASSHIDGKENENKIKKRRSKHHTVQRAQNKVLQSTTHRLLT